MKKIKDTGWGKLVTGYPWFAGENKYPIQAYSEFMPPLKTGISPINGSIYPWVFSESDMFGWRVLEVEEEYQLRPGMEMIAGQIFKDIILLRNGMLPKQLTGHDQKNINDNLFWSEELASAVGSLKHERYVTFLPFSLSKTKDDKGRIRWTLFGASEQGPEKAFWKSFYKSPDTELPETVFLSVMQQVFNEAYGISIESPEHLKNIGFRILPSGGTLPFSYWQMEKLPSWTKNFLVTPGDPYDDVKYLLTFCPFSKLPDVVKQKYLSGQLALFPFPGSLIPFGAPAYIRLQQTLYNAIQVPLLRMVKRHEESTGIRVPQSGWLHEPGVAGKQAEILEEFLVKNYIRTSRWDRFNRHENSLLKSTEIDPVIKTLFSTQLEALDLYNKPMARNCQIFSEHFDLILDGQKATIHDIEKAAAIILKGGLFRYRFYFPAMQVGLHEIFWHRPFVACLSGKNDQPWISGDLLTGYMTAYETGNPDLSHAIELWPSFRRNELHLSALNNFERNHDHYTHQTSLNILSLLDSWEFFGKQKLERSFARNLVRTRENDTLDDWVASFPGRAVDPETGRQLRTAVENILEPESTQTGSENFLTFNETANRRYEELYWNQIHFLAHGSFINKDNADVVTDPPTLDKVKHYQRDLHRLGDYLMESHKQSILASGMENTAEVGELPFKWETDFNFTEFGGWSANRDGSEYERNILVIIPGKNRKEAVVMADHYDTAYMADVFDTSAGGSGARLSAAGADDNYSATSTLLLAAPVFLKMSKEGKLEKDIWLLHLTGEEFPSDCMGARNFCENLVQKTLKMRKTGDAWQDLSAVEISGVLVMDMIAHNRDNGRNIFQISPGRTGEALKLAFQAHKANEAWNYHAKELNKLPDRKGCSHGTRVSDRESIPAKALHLMPKGEIRTWDDPYSSLYNTDGMIFSDTGIPVILFMENYDINRTGYHDTHDTMENIDLDYGAAISSIAIETLARLACSV